VFACLSGTTYPFSFAASVLQECDGALGQVRDQTVQAIEELQSPQRTDQYDQVGAVPGFDAFYFVKLGKLFLKWLITRRIGRLTRTPPGVRRRFGSEDQPAGSAGSFGVSVLRGVVRRRRVLLSNPSSTTGPLGRVTFASVEESVQASFANIRQISLRAEHQRL